MSKGLQCPIIFLLNNGSIHFGCSIKVYAITYIESTKIAGTLSWKYYNIHIRKLIKTETFESDRINLLSYLF